MLDRIDLRPACAGWSTPKTAQDQPMHMNYQQLKTYAAQTLNKDPAGKQ